MMNLTKLLEIVLMTVFFSSCDKENKTEDVNILTSCTWSLMDESISGFDCEAFEFGESKVAYIFKFFSTREEESPSSASVFCKDHFDYTLEGNKVIINVEGRRVEGILENNKLFMDPYGDGSDMYEYRPMKWNQLMRNNWICKVDGYQLYELSFNENKVGMLYANGDDCVTEEGTYTLKGSDIFINFEGTQKKGSIMNDNTVVFDGKIYEVNPYDE